MNPGRLRAQAVVVVLIAGSAVAAPQQTDPLAQLRQQVAAQGWLAWSFPRPIQWSDFRGEPPVGGGAAAQTASSFTYQVQCHGPVVGLAVLATFWPAQSWVRPDVARRSAESTRILLHERGHFNISEIFARRFRRAVSETTGLCPDHAERLTLLFNLQMKADSAMQDRYDRETVHGSAQEAQARWDSAIRASLDSLAAFAGPR